MLTLVLDLCHLTSWYRVNIETGSSSSDTCPPDVRPPSDAARGGLMRPRLTNCEAPGPRISWSGRWSQRQQSRGLIQSLQWMLNEFLILPTRTVQHWQGVNIFNFKCITIFFSRWMRWLCQNADGWCSAVLWSNQGSCKNGETYNSFKLFVIGDQRAVVVLAAPRRPTGPPWCPHRMMSALLAISWVQLNILFHYFVSLGSASASQSPVTPETSVTDGWNS